VSTVTALIDIFHTAHTVQQSNKLLANNWCVPIQAFFRKTHHNQFFKILIQVLLYIHYSGVCKLKLIYSCPFLGKVL